MASDVEICNVALQKLGAARISSLTEASVNARHCATAFEPQRDAELRAHPWSFAIVRAQLPADAVAPLFGKARSFTLPSDFIRLLSPDETLNFNNLDWKIEGNKIITDDSAPLSIRYVSRVTDANRMDTLFREALASRIALQICEPVTQSNTKMDRVERQYKAAVSEARRTNAIEKTAETPPEDTWVTVRN